MAAERRSAAQNASPGGKLSSVMQSAANLLMPMLASGKHTLLHARLKRNGEMLRLPMQLVEKLCF